MNAYRDDEYQRKLPPLHHNQGPSMPSMDDWKRSVHRRQNTPTGIGWDLGPWWGVGLVVVAVGWFVAGIQTGWFYFFPPVLLVVGLMIAFRGFTQD